MIKDRLLSLKSKFDYSNFLSKNTNLLLFLILFIGVIIPALSGRIGSNVYDKFLYISSSVFFNLMLGLCNVILIHKIIIFYHNTIFYTRYNNSKELLSDIIKTSVFSLIGVYVTGIVLAMAGSIIFCFSNFQMIKYNYYNLPVLIYILYLVIKNCIIHCLISIFGVLIVYKYSNNIVKILFLIILVLPYFLPTISKVNNLKEIPILHYYYYQCIQYPSFLYEILISILYCLILATFINVLQLKTNKIKVKLYENSNECD